jgi:hypothetical protein
VCTKSELSAEKAAREIEHDCIDTNSFGEIVFEVSRATAIILAAIQESREPQIETALFELAQCPYPLHDHVSKETWEFACKFVAERIGRAAPPKGESNVLHE